MENQHITNPSLYWVVKIQNFNADYLKIHNVFLKYDTQGFVNCDTRRWDSHLPSICYGYSSLRSTTGTFLGALVKLRKATSASSCLCLSIRMEHFGSHWTDFHKYWYLNSFQTPVKKIQVIYALTRIKGALHEIFIHLWLYLPEYLLEWECFRKSCRENQSVNFMFHNVLPKIVPFFW